MQQALAKNNHHWLFSAIICQVFVQISHKINKLAQILGIKHWVLAKNNHRWLFSAIISQVLGIRYIGSRYQQRIIIIGCFQLRSTKNVFQSKKICIHDEVCELCSVSVVDDESSRISLGFICEIRIPHHSNIEAYGNYGSSG